MLPYPHPHIHRARNEYRSFGRNASQQTEDKEIKTLFDLYMSTSRKVAGRSLLAGHMPISISSGGLLHNGLHSWRILFDKVAPPCHVSTLSYNICNSAGFGWTIKLSSCLFPVFFLQLQSHVVCFFRGKGVRTAQAMMEKNLPTN